MTDATHQFIVILSVIVIGGAAGWCLFDCWRNWYVGKILEREAKEQEPCGQRCEMFWTLDGLHWSGWCERHKRNYRGYEIVYVDGKKVVDCAKDALRRSKEMVGNENIRRTAENGPSNVTALPRNRERSHHKPGEPW